MPVRTVRHYREPPRDPSNLTPDLSIDLMDLSLAAAKETLMTGIHVSGWLNLFSQTLSPSTDLIWRDGGLGIGRELKRSFSNIFGRFLARHYLENHEGVLDLAPIEGSPMRLGNLVVQRKAGQAGDLPDWIGCTHNELVVAEAKGSHDQAKWQNKANPAISKPQTLEKAQQQVARVEIVRARRRPGSPIVFKGWSVGSRWGTEQNGVDPWLMAIDPKQGDEPPTPDEFTSAQRAILNRSNVLMLQNLGFVTRLDSPIDDIPIDQRYPSDAVFPVRWGVEKEIPDSLHAIAGPFGFLPIRNRREFRFVRIARRFEGQTALISVSKKRLGGILDASEPIRRGENSVERNGFTLTVIDRQTNLIIAE